MSTLLLVILLFLIFCGLIIWATVSSMNQSKKDWAIVHDLEKRMYELQTKEEIEAFHKELIEKWGKIDNDYVSIRLTNVDAYIRGLYKQYKVNPTNQ